MCNPLGIWCSGAKKHKEVHNVEKVYGLDNYHYKEYTSVTVLYKVVDILGFSLCLGCNKHNWATGKA